MQIRSELVEFLTSGVSLLVGTRDVRLVPACLRAMGVAIAADRTGLTVFVPKATGARTLANLRDNGRIAVTFSRVIDLKGVQIKGKCIGMRDATEAEHALQARYLDAFCGALEEIGMPRPISARFAFWPSVAVEVRAESLFEQTPGPSAGRALEGGA